MEGPKRQLSIKRVPLYKFGIFIVVSVSVFDGRQSSLSYGITSSRNVEGGWPRLEEHTLQLPPWKHTDRIPRWKGYGVQER